LSEDMDSVEEDIEMEVDTHDAVQSAQDRPLPLDGSDDRPLFFTDVAGDQSLRSSGPFTRIRSPSPVPSDSSDEVVIFRGRGDKSTSQIPTPIEQTQLAVPANTLASATHVTDALMDVLFEGAQQRARIEDVQPAICEETSWETKEDMIDRKPWTHADGTRGRVQDDGPVPETWNLEPAEGSRKSKKRRKRQNQQFRQELRSGLDEEMIQDYIDNMDDLDGFPVQNRALDLDDGDEWESSDMSDEDEDGEEEDDQIHSSEDSEEFDFDDESGDDSELEDELIYTEKEQWEDEEDLRRRQAEAMTDEEIARILAAQESLGIGGDEIVLFDDSGFGDLTEARNGLSAMAGTKTNVAGKTRKKGRKSDVFPNASLMADVLEQDPYNGFDIMDFDRPSLKPKAKGRKSAGGVPEELETLSDEELIAALQASWAADRNKKKSKKQEREELRAMGLLGGKGKKGKGNKPDLSQKYLEGMNLSQIKTEIRDFLDNEDYTTKAFPPMAKDDRRILHDIASHFNLNSNSRGSGKNRFTIVVKTQRTIAFSENHWTPIYGWAEKGFLPNMSLRQSKRNANKFKPTKAGAGGGFNKSAVSYRDGQIVGAGAAEIAESNFGRKLMEKMGWAKGMALGKEGGDREGRLLVPVEAKIKSGKGGLG